MNTDFPLKAQDAIIGDVIIYPEMDMSRVHVDSNGIMELFTDNDNKQTLEFNFRFYFVYLGSLQLWGAL